LWSAAFRIFIDVIIAIFILGAQWIVASDQPSAQIDSAHAPASSTVFPTDATFELRPVTLHGAI
jgi:hypothetical protein